MVVPLAAVLIKIKSNKGSLLNVAKVYNVCSCFSMCILYTELI